MEFNYIKMVMCISEILVKIKNMVKVLSFGLILYLNHSYNKINKYNNIMEIGGEAYLMEWDNISKIMVIYNLYRRCLCWNV
jgi:hypothetical protein